MASKQYQNQYYYTRKCNQRDDTHFWVKYPFGVFRLSVVCGTERNGTERNKSTQNGIYPLSPGMRSFRFVPQTTDYPIKSVLCGTERNGTEQNGTEPI